MEAPSGERLRGKRQLWCLLQVKLCDPRLCTLEWLYTIQGAIQVLGFFLQYSELRLYARLWYWT